MWSRIQCRNSIKIRSRKEYESIATTEFSHHVAASGNVRHMVRWRMEEARLVSPISQRGANLIAQCEHAISGFTSVVQMCFSRTQQVNEYMLMVNATAGHSYLSCHAPNSVSPAVIRA